MSVPIYVDFDDVLCETARMLAHLIGKQFGKYVQFEDIHSFQLDASFGLQVAEQEVLFGLFHDSDVLMQLQPVPGAIAGMQQWHRAGCRVEIVTGRPPDTADVSCAWLEAHAVPFEGITFVDKYQRGHGPVAGVKQMSMEEVSEAQFALAVDDSPTMALELARHAPYDIALFDRPWNRTLTTDGMPGRVMRCKGWAELIDLYPSPGGEAPIVHRNRRP